MRVKMRSVIGRRACSSRYERSHLRQQNDECGLPQVGGLAAHVRPGDEQDLVRGAVEVQTVGHKALALLLEKMFDDRMAAAQNQQFTAIGEFGTRVVPRRGQDGESGEHVELGDGRGGASQAGDCWAT